MRKMIVKAKISMPIKKGDVVHVVSGKEAGAFSNRLKRGKVLAVNRKSGRVLVERVNMVKRHSKPDRTNRQGGIVEKEAMIHVSNVMIVCPSCDRPVRIKARRLEDGRKLRACHRCNEILDT